MMTQEKDAPETVETADTARVMPAHADSIGESEGVYARRYDAERDPSAKTFAHFIQMLEDGYLHTELSDALRDLNANMNDHAASYSGKARGRITLNINFTLDKGLFEIMADVKVKKPEIKRDRTIAWSTPNNNFSPENPKQGKLFGPRAV